MEKFIPYEKLSKKQRRQLDRRRRNDWGELKPVSRKIESGKIYNRKKAKRERSSDASPIFYCFLPLPPMENRPVTISI